MARGGRIIIGMGSVTKPISFEESLLLPEDKSEEIIEGVPRHMPPASYSHARIIEAFRDALRDHLPSRQFVTLSSNFGQLIRRSPLVYRVPDLAVYKRAGLRAEHYVISTPELIVEVVSPANRKGDLQELLRHYAEISVPEVRFVYLDRKEVALLRLEGPAYRETGRVSDGSLDVLGASFSAAAIWNESL